MRVNNINGTSEHECRCGSWLEHWKRVSGEESGPCRVYGCSQPAVVGAHVLKEHDRNWYIVPMCTQHNAAKGGSLLIPDETTLVLANVNETCEKRVLR